MTAYGTFFSELATGRSFFLKIVTILGARPQFIKAAVVARALNDIYSGGIEEIIVHTGQHFDAGMSEVFFKQLGLTEPAYNLGINGGTHGSMTGRMIEGIEEVLIRERPDRVLLYGDTNSTLSGAIAASKLGLKIAHVESGLRSDKRGMPEEINRILTDHVSDWLFCPTRNALERLRGEGIVDDPGKCNVVLSGDVMFDSHLYFSASAGPPGFSVPGRYALATVHRAENVDHPLRLQAAMDCLAAVSEHLPVVFPGHPRTVAGLKEHAVSVPSNIILVPPVGYLEMLWLINRCDLVLTDSGGVQKEAFFNEKTLHHSS